MSATLLLSVVARALVCRRTPASGNEQTAKTMSHSKTENVTVELPQWANPVQIPMPKGMSIHRIEENLHRRYHPLEDNHVVE